MNLVQLDLFGLSAVVKKVTNKICYESIYLIEKVDDIYYCYVQKRKGKGRWSKKSLIEKSSKCFYIEYANNDLGLKLT
jgi:hypothetical protein